jgi:hypothetical protein
METPVDQETATADLVSDILAPTRHRSSAEVSDLARDLSSGSPGWREAWTLRGIGTQQALGDRPADEPALIPQGLSRAEDDELRRLHWLSRMGALALRRAERLIELRLRDRRTEIREPREFAVEQASTPNATVLSRPTDDLVEVRRQLESMAHSRLILPFDDHHREKYRKLLAAEQSLIERSKGNKNVAES